MTRTRRLQRPTAGGALLALLLTCGLLAAGAPAAGEQVRLEPTSLDALDPAGLDVGEDGIRLSLDQAVEIALRRNLGLVIERYNWIQAREGVLQSLGIYDLGAFATVSTADSTAPSGQVVEGVGTITSKRESLNLGLRQLVPTGGLIDVTFLDATRTESNNRNLPLNPLYSASSGISFTQPLLRGFGRLATERRILVARTSSAQASAIVEQQVAQTIQDVETAYWNLVGARNQLVVAQDALKLAQVLHEQNEVRVDVGTLAPLELVQSEAGIANREEDIIVAESAIGDAEDNLRLLLNLEQGAYWDAAIIPVTEAETERIEIDGDEAVETALRERPEVASQAYRIEALQIDRRYFRNLSRPQLDLVFSYGLFGQAGESAALIDPDTGDVIQPAIQGGLSDAIDDVRARDFDSWSAQLTFSYALQNRERRAQATIAELALDQGLAELAQLEQQIRTEVRAAARQVETAAKQIESARISRRLEERNLDAERKRYENGMSSSFRVLQIQDDLTQARSREVSAVASYRRALASYYRALGVILDQQGVELEGETREWHRYGGWSHLWGGGE
jgi:outer membrane protein TolC